MYACDARWWYIHGDAARAVCGSATRFISQYDRNASPDQDLQKKQREISKLYNVELFAGAHAAGLGRDAIHYGQNSGYQAINLAYLLGASRIILLGYDMQRGKKTHFFGSHPKDLCDGPRDFRRLIALFEPLAEDLLSDGVEVINCTRSTALHCFPQRRLDEL